MSSRQFNNVLSHSKLKKNHLTCVVCGSTARGYNFNAITCMSCKIFFRRNALARIDTLNCYQGGNCLITPQTRRYCTYCRLRICFRMGMRKELIQKSKESSRFNVDRNQQMQTRCPEFIRPLDLLQWSDRSQLSNNDWLLLSQLSSILDTLGYHIALKAHEMYCELLTIGIQPLKMRAKASYIYEMTNSFVNSSLEFVKSIPQYILLPPLNRQTLLIRNTRPGMMFYASYQMNFKPVQRLIQTPYWITSIECLLLPSTKCLCDELTSEIGHVSFIDPCLIKLILVILAFSTNNIDHDEMIFNQQLNEYYHTFVLHRVQSMYVELMWKYMIYRFGEKCAINIYSAIIKIILRVQSFVSIMDNSRTLSEQKFNENIVKITDQTMRINLENELRW